MKIYTHRQEGNNKKKKQTKKKEYLLYYFGYLGDWLLEDFQNVDNISHFPQIRFKVYKSH